MLDTFKGYLIPDIKATISSTNTDLLVIPGGMMSQLQVLDLVVNKPFRPAPERGSCFDPSWKNQGAQCDSVCWWIIMALQHISPELIVKRFKQDRQCTYKITSWCVHVCLYHLGYCKSLIPFHSKTALTLLATTNHTYIFM
jgi:hypothetical protein